MAEHISHILYREYHGGEGEHSETGFTLVHVFFKSGREWVLFSVL